MALVKEAIEYNKPTEPDLNKYQKLIDPPFPDKVDFYESDSMNPFEAECEFPTFLRSPYIKYSSDLKERDLMAWRFVMLHEIGHSKDCISKPLFFTTIFVVMRVAFKRYFLIPTLLTLANENSAIILKRIQEEWADFYARQRATKEELEGGLRFMKEAHRVFGDDDSWISTHPSFSTRIKKIEERLKINEETPIQ